ncbi:hypothetical protein J23TS9_16150 [Paenibacillus sp. J23TS9]|nr:hypothetical protein J23TS9_16150 [Paenibacillus sp. J23TS9]
MHWTCFKAKCFIEAKGENRWNEKSRDLRGINLIDILIVLTYIYKSTPRFIKFYSQVHDMSDIIRQNFANTNFENNSTIPQNVTYLILFFEFPNQNKRFMKAFRRDPDEILIKVSVTAFNPVDAC